ncbi:Aste57867_11696 [Aphanomyces stellatus]|uniref:Aste57867_11696 protein n=1 Tax=Aphanomyces stellatus TaxID=120398 RepID=A0A485KU79_9STRA|nr:hypothetical protein As57867_011653 [Aphanomyces stellatus]VFT88553.1 Aste57867_11696 [Aphanomyces stellatus]
MASIGIDLGTTYCCVGVWQNGRVEIVSNESGKRITPSYVSFTANDRLVGMAAKVQAAMNSRNTVFDAKRLIGRKFADAEVGADAASWPFTVGADADGKPQFQVDYLGKTQQRFYPEEISSMLLRHMKDMAESYLGSAVTHAVVTVPAYFNKAQKDSTMQAAALAGLTVQRMLVEPTAAAIAYGIKRTKKDTSERVLVYDWGGGTFDVSLLDLTAANVFHVQATAGNSHLGGQDLDSRLVAYCLDHVKRQLDCDLTDSAKSARVLQRVRRACEQAKVTLSTATEATIKIDGLVDGRDFQLMLSRTRLEALCQDHFDETMTHVASVLRDARLTPADVGQVVLMGGSSRIPKVQQMLQAFFGGKTLNKSINPDEAVAVGATMVAAQAAGSLGTHALTLEDATPISLGIAVKGDIMSTVIRRHTTYPVQLTKSFETTVDNQSVCDFRVFEGERELAAGNESLGRFSVVDLPRRAKGAVKFNVTFEIDANGLLKVTSEVTDTKQSNSIETKDYTKRFTDEKIAAMLADAKRYEEEDRREKRRIEARLRLDDYLYNQERWRVSNSVPKKILRQTRQWLTGHPGASKATYEQKLIDLQVLEDSDTDSDG